MPIIENDTGNAGRSGRDTRFDNQPSPLSKWDQPSTAKTKPQPYRPLPGTRFDPERLKQLTPYAMPVPVERAEAKPAPVTNAGHDAGRVAWAEQLRANQPDKAKATLPEQETRLKKRRTYRLTWDEYNKLSDEQRAAVDFNTALVQAREQDLNSDQKPSADKLEEYQEQAERMFGEGRGSEQYAPQTLGVLMDMDFKSSGEEDLDDFLGLKHTIGLKDLKNFSFEKEVRPPQVAASPETTALLAGISPGGAGGLDTDQRAGVYTQNLQDAMKRAGEVLQTWRASAARSRNEEVLRLGGTANDPKVAKGYGERPPFIDLDNDGDADKGNIHGFFQNTLVNLAVPELDPNVEWATAQQTLRPREMKSLMKYLDEMSGDETLYASVMKGVKNARPREEFRGLLGLDKGEADGRR